MWELIKNSTKMFVRGKLFANHKHAFGMAALGAGVTAALFVGAAKAGMPVLAAAPVAAFLGGCLQPRLYKNLKFQ